MSTPPVGLGLIAGYRGRTYVAAIGPGDGEVTLFSETPQPGFDREGDGYWRLRVPRAELERLTLLRTVGVFGGEPCLVLAEEEDDEGGLHIAYAGHDGRRAEELGYWLVDHGAYEVVVPPEEVHAIRVEQVPVPLGGDQEPSDR
ncbi:hypothetical protein [Thermobispora bispora]|jgi:hypothetical protein|uniref:Uncharacterized protein n=1 Tax=Thermobispora bispora (strain ATCC 19993 / DSM 43833 / CBS 139.67 / JCM 10125 / KCTC 9307 / NBRC 14880 / R51) TaxID=469371 RepID=D6Y356_THEBD|nr:hypothetical protein [Thermobispora bispora]MBO2474712.1 hypothetical protein [Actinomycetales bacterium]MDI9580707.1 hypothetical protein [Thermobispora sp.]ADG88931.1 hypothetical protein Tbis_2221 [Thermobispora bispora DSM 43833]MBX6167873.1 hypothetical protein [Thermobispora bispora]QSI48674.1 hypothetical protein CYL17_13030 [Thermobispora bispora]